MTFPLLPYSQLVQELIGTVPGIYDYPILLRVRKSDVDTARIEAAIRLAIRNHPVFSMMLDSAGHTPLEPADELHGPYHSVTISESDGYVQFSARFNRILGDMTSLMILADDVSRAYIGLELAPDRYTDYLKIYWERRNASDSTLKKWFDVEFGGLSCPVRPHTDTPLETRGFEYFDVLTDSIPYSGDLLQRQHVTLSGFVSLCSALAIMDYEGSDSAALTWAYAGRDQLSEQHIYGSLHKDIPFVITRSCSPDSLFKQARNQIRSGITHSDYPYTLTPPQNNVWNYAANVLQQPDISTVLSYFPFNIEVLDPLSGAPQVAYSILDIELLPGSVRSVDIVYRYSAAHYRKESIERFARLVHSNAQWLMGGHQRTVYSLEKMVSSDAHLAGVIGRSIEIAAERCPDRRFNPVRSLEDLYSFLDRFLVSRPWESLGLGPEDMSLFRRIDQSTGYFLYIFDQPLKELESKGYLYPSVQYIPSVAEWIKEFNNAWREYLDSPASWDDSCLELVSSDPLFGMEHGWYESSECWHCWNDFFSRRLSGSEARPLALSAVTAPADGVFQDTRMIANDNCLDVPDGLYIKTAAVRSIAELLGDSPYRESFAGGLFAHLMLDFYDYHRLHSPVTGVVADIRTIPGISGSGGVVVWNPERGRYEYANPGEPGFQMLETRGVVIIDTADMGLVALVAVGMAQVCSVNWNPGLSAGCKVQKGDELGYFLCGGSDAVLLFQKNANLQPAAKAGSHLLMGNGLFEISKHI